MGATDDVLGVFCASPVVLRTAPPAALDTGTAPVDAAADAGTRVGAAAPAAATARNRSEAVTVLSLLPGAGISGGTTMFEVEAAPAVETEAEKTPREGVTVNVRED